MAQTRDVDILKHCAQDRVERGPFNVLIEASGTNDSGTARSGPADGDSEESVVDAAPEATLIADASICVDIDLSSYDTQARRHSGLSGA